MKERDGVSYVPSDHGDEASNFYKIQLPISTPNDAVAVGHWVTLDKLIGFGAEAPREADQCRHVDGSTMVRTPHLNSVSWLV